MDNVICSLNLPFQLKELQLKCLEKLVNSEDVFAVLPTGYGKTVIYTVLPTILWELKMKKQFAETLQRSTSIVIVISPLVSLMKDQLINIKDLDVDCAYLGEDNNEDAMNRIKNGQVPILLMSPESLFSGSWRQLLETEIYRNFTSAIVVDEAHCVDQWGAEFRTDYCRIGELRSILPQAVMLALTATATKEVRVKISKLLGMNRYDEIIGCCDRSNIMYFAKKASNNIEANFTWLVDELRIRKVETPKCIIYCRNIKTCAEFYSLFRKQLGKDSYIGVSSAKNCLYGMFHHSTPAKNKKLVIESFRKPDCTLRVVVATNAFGMGVNVKDINKIVHWGAPRNISSFMQESGRAGRDNKPSFSIMYFHGVNISETATDKMMRNYCLLTTCRRDYLLQYFSPENTNKIQVLKHNCCDICSPLCDCGACPIEFKTFLTDEVDNILIQSGNNGDVKATCNREIDSEKRAKIKQAIEQLHELRESMVQTESPTLLTKEILTGLSDLSN